jgi:hypothetical protein
VSAETSEGGSIWEDGLGRHDVDARVLWEAEAGLTADPQSVRYGDGKARLVVQTVVSGPAYRGRPVVDLAISEGLRPLYARLTPEQAREAGAMLTEAAERADAEGPG